MIKITVHISFVALLELLSSDRGFLLRIQVVDQENRKVSWEQERCWDTSGALAPLSIVVNPSNTYPGKPMTPTPQWVRIHMFKN